MPGMHPPRRQHPVQHEFSNGFASSSRHPSASGSGSYYYSRGGGSLSSNAPSPAIPSYARVSPQYNGVVENTMAAHDGRNSSTVESETPSYWVEHLATFAVGREFGLQFPEDGVKKLKQLENNSAIWAQPMVLRLRPNVVSVEDENGDLVEQFPQELVTTPTAHLSMDPRDVYNNILLFIVKEDKKHGKSINPTEMHIFQCNRVSANEVVEDMNAFLTGHYKRVRTGRRDTDFMIGHQTPVLMGSVPRGYRDDASASSDTSESFERDVNTLNRCFDDFERFVARIQSAAIAQRELEAQANRQRTAHRKRGSHTAADQQSGILQMRAQLPAEFEFIDILQKFKLSFNLLAKLKNHIHEPNAPELLHFLFTPLTIILDACHWGLGRNIAPQVVSPLLSRETCELMQNCLNSKESDVWMALGEAWRIPPEEWIGQLPKPYRPVFLDGFAPYGPPDMYDGSQSAYRYQPMPQPIHRGVSAPPPPTQNSYTQRPPIRDRSVDNLNVDLDRMTMEKERLEFERAKIAERERRLIENERRIMQEKQRLAAEKELIAQEAEQRSMGSSYTARQNESSRQVSPAIPRRTTQPYSSQSNEADQLLAPLVTPIPYAGQSPRQKAFLDDIISRRGKLAQVTYDRVAQNPKELTVSRGEFLEILNDSKNWWECSNVHRRVGYVPHNILTIIRLDLGGTLPGQDSSRFSDRTGNLSQQNSASSSRRIGMMSDDVPEYIKQRQDASVHSVEGSSSRSNGEALSEQLNSIKLRAVKQQAAVVVDKTKDKETWEEAQGSANDPQQQHMDELRETIKSGRRSTASRRARIQAASCIEHRSSPEQIQEWLTSEGFSPRVHQLLNDFTGAHLFSLNKPSLIAACGRAEGSRLYSKILLQKNELQAPNGNELEAILDHRKARIDNNNQSDNDNKSDNNNA